MQQPAGPTPSPRIDWEAFYRNYRKPGYVPGYEIVNKLGGGVFGMVYKARKESIGKDYAIKFLKVDDEVVRDAVLRELEAVRFFAQIDHPNLVSIEDKGEIDGIPFILMNYAGEETLKKRLESGAMSREEALRIFLQAARGVHALHEHSLVHFDLKPANIFLKGDIARVGDYGLSKLVTESRNSLSFGRGTPYYMAPEMLQRRGDHRSDIYSLGVILYECLTGDVPFKGDSEWEVLRKHETEAPRFPAHLPDSDRRVIERCLAKRPEDRFPSVAELLRALQAPASLGESLVIPAAVSARALEPRPAPARGQAPAAAAAPAAAGSGPRAEGSPYGLPWQADAGAQARGPIGALVHLVFRLFEVGVFLLLAPLRAVSTVLGKLIAFLIQLPFKILGFAFRFTGFVVVALLLLLLLVAALSFVTSSGVAVPAESRSEPVPVYQAR
ncbi:MAG: serine/threonine protein kinase [Planctomycetes bacterium]|nr:serine/threonine protein kinase [Planctomycetota bacterium]